MIDEETLTRLGWPNDLIKAAQAAHAAIHWKDFTASIEITSEAMKLEYIEQRPLVVTESIRLTIK